MKATVALPAIILLCLNLAACAGRGASKTPESTVANSPSGSESGATPPTQTTSSPVSRSYWKYDGDKDSDDYAHSRGLPDDDDDRNLLAPYPDKPGQAELQAIIATVRRYYTAAAGGNGAQACGLLDTSLAAGLGTGAGRPSHSSSNGCAAAVDRIFKEQHRQLIADEPATMVVTGVHVKGTLGLALLGFRTAPEGAILIERESGIWKLGSLFDSEIP